jgi:hypothetical protein
MALGRSYNPIWFVVDLNGLALDDTYYMFTLYNTLPYLPQTLAIDENGTPSDNPIQFLANGTLPVDLYWDDEAVYRIEIRQGNTQADPLIYEINNYIPIGSEGPTPPPGNSTSLTDNQITNPQFSVFNIASPSTFSSADTYAIAPGWDLILAGSGTAVVSQRTYTGDEYTPNNATNASYGLRIVNNGFTSVKLRQRFDHNGALWTGADSISSDGPGVVVNFTASSSANFDLTVELEFSDSSTSPIATVPITNRVNEDFSKPAPIVVSASSIAADVAYTDLVFSFTGSLTFDITSVQLLQQDVVEEVIYGQTTLERQVDHMFHYYQPALDFKPIPSLLTGWDFPLNPCQFGSTKTITTTASYIWDQTICKSAVGNVSVTKGSTSGAFIATTSNPNEAIYMLQYLSGSEALETTLSNLSVNIAADVSFDLACTVRVYLYYSNGGGTIPVVPTTIGTLAASGVFSLTAANWAPVPNIYSNTSSLLNYNNGMQSDTSFNGFDGESFFGATATSNFAIVVTFALPTSGSILNVNSISLVPGDIPTRPAPQTQDEVLRECQYYYEMSYAPGGTTNPAGTASYNNCVVKSQAANLKIYLTAGAKPKESYSFTQEAIDLQFKQTKINIPTTTIYSTITLNASNKVTAHLDYNYDVGAGTIQNNLAGDTTFSALWNPVGTGTQALYWSTPASAFNTSVLDTPEVQVNVITDWYWASAYITFHYTCDSRLGVV